VAVDYFLKIDGVAGESRDSKHKDEIELQSFSWGAHQVTPQAGGGGGGAGAGKVSMQDFHFVMRTNKASPKLFLACASGQHLKSAVLTARKAGKDQQEFLVYKFTDLLVSGYQTGGSEGTEVPVDQVSFNFAKVQTEYRPQNPTGQLGTAVTAGWDVKANKALKI